MMTPCEVCKNPQALHRSDEELLAKQQALNAEGATIYAEGGNDDPRLTTIDSEIIAVETARNVASELTCSPDTGCTRDQYLRRTIQNLATRSQVSI